MLGGMFAASASGPWQMQYAIPDWQQRMARLNPQQEAAFEAWARQNHAPVTPDYDMRAFWLHGAQGSQVNANDGMMHFPDTYKTPLHQSFSGESIFANPKAHPPMWNELDQLVTPDGRVLFDERAARRR